VLPVVLYIRRVRIKWNPDSGTKALRHSEQLGIHSVKQPRKHFCRKRFSAADGSSRARRSIFIGAWKPDVPSQPGGRGVRCRGFACIPDGMIRLETSGGLQTQPVLREETIG
jgi:hypothetical protein